MLISKCLKKLMQFNESIQKVMKFKENNNPKSYVPIGQILTYLFYLLRTNLSIK